jgi:mRNA-degrading endonuclease RelE of RelBE toxin-antitoxin system
MKTIVEKRVFKEAEKLPRCVQELAAQQIEVLKAATTLSNVPNVVPMEGTEEPYYRLKFSNYRFMLYYDIENKILKVLSLTHRKDSYKKHNLPWKK